MSLCSIASQLHRLCRSELGQLNFLYEHQLSVYQSDISATVELIQHLKTHSPHGVVICLCDNPMPPTIMARYLDCIAAQVDPDGILVLNWDANNVVARLAPRWCIQYWPFFWLEQLSAPDQDRNVLAKSGRIGMLSGNARYHRLHLWHRIRSQTLPQDVVVVNSTQADSSVLNFAHDLQLDVDKVLQNLPWSNRSKYIDQVQGQPIDHNGLISHPAFRCWVNIAAESTACEDTLFVSEKTWKAIRSRSLMMTFGDRGMIPWLAQQGFWIWPCDRDVDWRHKLDIISALFDRDDLGTQWQQHRAGLDHNLAHFMHRGVIGQVIKPALECMQDLV